MGKKKGKKTKQDLRGYSTSASIPKAVPLTVTADTVDDNFQEMDSISSPPDGNLTAEANSKTTEIGDTISKRFFRKIENLHDRLVHCKFSDNQIDKVIIGLGSDATTICQTVDLYTLDSALDWLCLNEITKELPSLFTEQGAREAAMSNVSTSIEVVLPVSKSSHDIVFDISIAQSSVLEQSLNQTSPTDVACADVGEPGVEDVEDPTVCLVMEELVEPKTTPVSASELRLQMLEVEIEQLRFELNDEATNYMRSKHEIKDLKQQMSMLQGLAKKLRITIVKQNAKQTKLVADVTKGEVSDDPSVTHQDSKNDETEIGLEEDDLGEAFSIFDEVDADRKPQRQEGPESPDLNIPDSPLLQSSHPSIPTGWTGSTPKKELEEWCKKQKLARPTFPKDLHVSNSGSYQLRIQTKPETWVEDDGPFNDLAHAQQYLSTIALYRLFPDRPLFRLFPPVFRDLWKCWLREREEANSILKQGVDEIKNKRIKSLIELIPTHLRIGESKEISTNPEKLTNSVEEGKSLKVSVDLIDTEIKQSKGQSGLHLMEEFSRRRKSPAYMAMHDERQRLPMSAYRDDLLKCIANHPVTVLCAETGAGKTTQAPQFMLEEALGRSVGHITSIICTQPRRISAISVAERVADEMCVKLGDLVGYQIRGDSTKSQRTKLLFCTTGVILRRLQEDPVLSGVTIVIVDEVHERSWQIDFLLIALRHLLQTSRPDLKVLLMSATLNSELFCSFFSGAPLLSVPGRTYPVSQYFLEDLMDATDHVIEEDSVLALRNLPRHRNTESLLITTRGGEQRRQVVELESQTDCSKVSGHFAGYKMTTQRSMDRVDEKVLNYDLIEDAIALLSDSRNSRLLTPNGDKPADGSVLVFLPGMAEIRTMMNRLSGSRVFGNTERFSIIPLHSSLSPQDQKRVFYPSRRGCRKIILATNIAETSVTIPDVVSVIDTGLVREVRQNKRFSTSKLVLDWCSKASIKQRAGRAGRVREGICCRLFSSRTAELIMQGQTMPELQRIPLEEVCLSILAGKLSSSCERFLMHAPQPPPSDSVSLAIRSLCTVGIVQVINGKETLTALGQHVAKIPVNVRLAKMLIFGALFKCLDPIVTIVSALSVKSPFVQSMHDTTKADAAQRKFRDDSSDFLTLVNLWDAYLYEGRNSKDEGRAFCRRNWVNWSVMLEIRDLRQQNLELLSQIGFVQGIRKQVDLANSVYNINGKHAFVVHAVICSGLYPNIAHVIQEGKDNQINLWYKQERLHFHSSSVNHKKKSLVSDWIVFHEKFDSGRTTISVTSPIHPLTIILFGGTVVVKHLERKVVVDTWIELDIAAQTGVMFRELRKQLDAVLISMIENVDSPVGNDVVEKVVKLIRK